MLPVIAAHKKTRQISRILSSTSATLCTSTRDILPF
jgi:hypothetical protein